MSDDELAYLSPDYDLNSLTIPKLRSILVSHDISYPSSAKKAQLIQILEDQVLPKAKRLLAARARTKRTSYGIENVPSSQEGTEIGDDDAELMPPPPAPKTPGRRKKTSTGTDASEDDAAAPSTSRRTKTPGAKTPGRRKTIKSSDTETDTNTETVRPSARKNRRSGEVSATPSRKSHVRAEVPEPVVKAEPVASDSPFSEENPFQSGSPDPAYRRVSSDGRRKSLGISSEKRKSATRRRETRSPETPAIKQDGEPSAPSRSTFNYRVSELQADNEVQPSEEFTPEEQLELVRDRAASGYSGKDLIPARRTKKNPASATTKSLPLVVLTILLSAFGFWWRKEKLEIGYCGVGKPHWSLADTKVPQWANTIEPKCEPCPQHAYCYPNLDTRCENGWVLQPHPYSLYGAVPLPPTCEPDGEKARRVKFVSDRAVEELRERRAQYECGDLPDTGTPEIAEEELKEELKTKKNQKMSDMEFDELWTLAIGDIVAREEVVVEDDQPNTLTSITTGTRGRKLTSTSLARLSYACSARRRLRLTLSLYRIPLLLLIATSIFLLYLRSRLRSYRAATAQIPHLVAETLDRLATQASLKQAGETDEGWISIGQLRDDVLREVLRQSDRERVWKHVRGVVEGNANVRVGNRELGSGEWGRVWEWIGPTGRRPGGAGSGRKSGVHFLEDADADVAGTSGNPSGATAPPPSSEARNWNEGRPIF